MKKLSIFLTVLFITQLCSAQGNWIKVGFTYGPMRTYHLKTPVINSDGLVFENGLEITQRISLSLIHFTAHNRFWEFGAEATPGRKQDLYRDITPTQPGSPNFERIGFAKSQFYALMIERGRNFKPECSGTRFIYGAWFVSPFFNSHAFTDALNTDNQYGQRLKNGGLVLGISPRFFSFVGKRLLVEFGMRLNMLSMAYSDNRIDNPALTNRQRKNNSFDFDSLNGMSFRLAVGLRTDRNKEK